MSMGATKSDIDLLVHHHFFILWTLSKNVMKRIFFKIQY